MLRLGMLRLGAWLGFDACAGAGALLLMRRCMLGLGIALGIGTALRLGVALRRGTPRGPGIHLWARAWRRGAFLLTGVGPLGAAKAYSISMITVRPLMRPYVAHCLTRRRARAGSRSGRALVMHRPMRPLLTLLEEGAIVVVATPVRVERESHHRNAESWGVCIQGHVATLVLVCDVRRIEPAAIAVEADVTPAPIIEATHDLNRCVRVELRYRGVGAVGTGVNIRRVSGHSVLCCCRRGQCQQTRTNRHAQTSGRSHGRHPPVLLIQERTQGSAYGSALHLEVPGVVSSVAVAGRAAIGIFYAPKSRFLEITRSRSSAVG